MREAFWVVVGTSRLAVVCEARMDDPHFTPLRHVDQAFSPLQDMAHPADHTFRRRRPRKRRQGPPAPAGSEEEILRKIEGLAGRLRRRRMTDITPIGRAAVRKQSGFVYARIRAPAKEAAFPVRRFNSLRQAYRGGQLGKPIARRPRNLLERNSTASAGPWF